jgi:hypothetical protein
VTGKRIANLRLRTARGPLQPAGAKPVLVRLAASADHLGRLPVTSIHAVDEHGRLPGITAILLRPDGYVAWAGDDEEELERAIGTLLSTEGRKEHV